MSDYVCRICRNQSNNKVHEAYELMLGTQEKFAYFECDQCGCLQISEIPENMSKYYPSGYYSFTNLPAKGGPVKTYLLNRRNKYAVDRKGVLGRFLYAKFPKPNVAALAHAKINRDSRILDVGCGAGDLLDSLHAIGYTDLSGIDPFAENVPYNGKYRIERKNIEEVSGEWDLIMFHHSFEHLPNPRSALESVSQRLGKNGTCLLRIPVFPSYAWQRYGMNWVQFDAPRHLFLHSTRSIEQLCRAVGLKLVRTEFDSNEFQFWGSEQYEKGIALFADRSYAVNPKKSLFSQADIKRFRAEAEDLNRSESGDQAAFYLQKV